MKNITALSTRFTRSATVTEKHEFVKVIHQLVLTGAYCKEIEDADDIVLESTIRSYALRVVDGCWRLGNQFDGRLLIADVWLQDGSHQRLQLVWQLRVSGSSVIKSLRLLNDTEQLCEGALNLLYAE